MAAKQHEDLTCIFIKPHYLSNKPERVYVIGDIHGCLEELSLLVEWLYQTEKITLQDQLIFIGDYINKGSASREVVDLLLQIQRDFPHSIFIKGNHEEMLLSYFGFSDSAKSMFLKNGGDLTLASYSVNLQACLEEQLSSFPISHIEFYRSLYDLVVSDRHIFVHAGLSPLRDINKQVSSEIYWIRQEFISNIHNFNRVVVFGHTPLKDVLFDLPYKIGIDTGLVYGNMLSCIELSQGRLLQIRAGKKKIVEKLYA